MPQTTGHGQRGSNISYLGVFLFLPHHVKGFKDWFENIKSKGFWAVLVAEDRYLPKCLHSVLKSIVVFMFKPLKHWHTKKTVASRSGCSLMLPHLNRIIKPHPATFTSYLHLYLFGLLIYFFPSPLLFSAVHVSTTRWQQLALQHFSTLGLSSITHCSSSQWWRKKQKTCIMLHLLWSSRAFIFIYHMQDRWELVGNTLELNPPCLSYRKLCFHVFFSVISLLCEFSLPHSGPHPSLLYL